jgi:thiol-disulfide isomerase/thioredoxin
MTTTPIATPRPELVDYSTGALRAEPVYRGYKPRRAVLEQVAERLPTAHVVVVSGDWCGDCRREVPKLTRILEELPATWSVTLEGEDRDTRSKYDVLAIPTFLVFDQPGGRELGRIIESPSSHDGIEGDLLTIAEHASTTA